MHQLFPVIRIIFSLRAECTPTFFSQTNVTKNVYDVQFNGYGQNKGHIELLVCNENILLFYIQIMIIIMMNGFFLTNFYSIISFRRRLITIFSRVIYQNPILQLQLYV